VETPQEPCPVEDSEGSPLSTTVVLENVQETVKECLLVLLVENVSGLSEENGDFSLEMIPEIRAAVVTFAGNSASGDFAEKLNQNHRAKQQNITARCLELTKSVRVENIPPDTPSDYITVYFENKKNGAAQVVDVQQLPAEGAAIITFSDHKDVTNILEKQHSLNRTPISVYPYYTSLGTALYGKEGPQIKQPDPITVSLDVYIWYYLQRDNTLIESISCEMAKYNCVLTWPEPPCEDPKVTLHPSAALSERKRLVAQLIKTWNETVSTAFSRCISKYRAVKCQASAEVWEAVRTSFNHDEVMIIPYTSNDLLVLVGEKEVVKDVERELNVLIEKAAREIEREKQRTEEIVVVGPGEYAILQSTGLEEKMRKEFPALKISYDHLQKIINLCGVPEEVYKVKGELLDSIRKMAKKTVNIHPYVFSFLEQIDSETLSQSLFMAKQIGAFYELDAEAMVLKGSTPEDLQKAEEEVKKELVYKSIALEDDSVLQKEEWKVLTQQVCSNGAVTVTRAESQVVVAGCSRPVAKAFEELFGFVDENTHMQKVIGGRPLAVVLFFQREKTRVWDDLKNQGVKVEFGTQGRGRTIALSGPRRAVLKGVTLVEEALSGLHYKRVVIKEPGAKSYFKERENFFAASIKQDFQCLVRLEEQSEEQLEERKEGRNLGQPYQQVSVGGVTVAVYKADLCTHPVDVVVNASNEELKHIGGLAGALLEAAGPELQRECDELVRRNGRLQPGCAVITGAGKLPCKNVVHAVGPRWREDEAEKCMYLLRKTVRKSLQLADTFNHSSIALPAVSAGIFGFPLEPCARSIVLSLKETLEGSLGDGSLKEVHLVDISQNNVQAFSKALGEVFPVHSPSHGPPRRPSKRRAAQVSQSFPLLRTKEGLNIQLKRGSIEEATTDIIVISIAQDLQLDKGPLSKALLSKAGPMLQTSLREEGQRKRAEEGCVLRTKGYGLGCRVVLHAIVPPWSQRRTSAEVLGDVIMKCLQIAEELTLKSITFPAIGTGNLGFPKSVVAKLLFDKVFEYSSRNGVCSLQEVHFLLHPKDTANIQGMHSLWMGLCFSLAALAGTSSSLAQNANEVTIGSVVFRVVQGDITKEEGDVIVNITNQTFSLKTGVSRAILSGAGKAVEDECAQLASQSNKNYITTQAGSLPCKKIIHFVAQDDIKDLVSQVLQECELQQYTSVAFPAIGTGEARRDPAVVAANMLDAVSDFARSNSTPAVKTVKVVIFQPHLLGVFQGVLQKKESPAKTPPKSWFSKLASLLSSEKRSPKEKPKPVLENKIDLAVVQICGEDKARVEEAENWLKSVILKEQFQKEITDESVVHFGEAENEELHNLQKRLKIALRLEGSSVQISGVGKDVWIAYSAVQEMIHKVKAAKQAEIRAELLQNLIEWKYLQGDSYVPFDSLTNMHLENALMEKKKTISVIIDGRKSVVDVEARFALGDQGKRVPLVRIDKSEDQESTVLPATWDDMQNQRVKLVELKPETREYRDVQEKFLLSCQGYKIEKVKK
ncbi:PAR14 polymerase, partial [Alcedo cyanopectus]|nr:PAR14 polymerase [Ceyx cyanopectus]